MKNGMGRSKKPTLSKSVTIGSISATRQFEQRFKMYCDRRNKLTGESISRIIVMAIEKEMRRNSIKKIEERLNNGEI